MLARNEHHHFTITKDSDEHKLETMKKGKEGDEKKGKGKKRKGKKGGHHMEI